MCVSKSTMVGRGAEGSKLIYLDMPDFGLDVLLVQLVIFGQVSQLYLVSNLFFLEAVQHKESGEFVQAI